MLSIKVFQFGIILVLALFLLSKCSSPALDHMRAEDERRTKHVNKYLNDRNAKHTKGTATSSSTGGKEVRNVE